MAYHQIVILTKEQISLLKNLINNEGQRVSGRPGATNDEKLVELGEILTALQAARPAP